MLEAVETCLKLPERQPETGFKLLPIKKDQRKCLIKVIYLILTLISYIYYTYIYIIYTPTTKLIKLSHNTHIAQINDKIHKLFVSLYSVNLGGHQHMCVCGRGGGGSG